MTGRNWYQDYMTDGERVMWESEPVGFRWSAVGRDFAMLLAFAAAVSWGGFILQMLLTDQNVPGEMQAFMLIVIGLWLLMAGHEFIGPWLVRQRGLRSAAYVVTDRRILRRRAGLVDSLLISQLPEPILTDEHDGRGTIRFWSAAANNPESGSCRANMGNLAGFEMRQIPQALKVCELLRGLKEQQPTLRPVAEAPFLPIQPEERLLWQGSPHRWRCLAAADRSRLPGAVWALTVIGGFDLLVVLLVGWQPDIWVVHLVLLGMAAVCLIPCLVPFIRDVRRIRGTRYVLTDRRIQRGSRGYTGEKALDRNDATLVYMAQGKEGVATLMLASHAVTPGGRVTFSDASPTMEGFQLLYVEDAARVMDMIGAALARNNGKQGNSA